MRKYKGSFTIETALILPIVVLVFIVCAWGGFYYHDKNVLSSCAYEIAVVGSTKVREDDVVNEEMLREAFAEQINKKCILFSGVEVSVHIGEEKVDVEAAGKRRNMKVTVLHSAAITKPESYVRKIRKLQ